MDGWRLQGEAGGGGEERSYLERGEVVLLAGDVRGENERAKLTDQCLPTHAHHTHTHIPLG